MNVFWLEALVNLFALSLTGSGSIGVLCGSFQLPTSFSVHCLSLQLCPRAAALTTAVWLVWHQWFCSTFPPLLWLCAVYLSALCLMRSCLSHVSHRRRGPDFLMFTPMCLISGAVLDEQNVITCCMYSSNYDFLFSCCIPAPLFLCLCHSTLLYEKLLWMPFSPQAPAPLLLSLFFHF